jgi:hypothetical protein
MPFYPTREIVRRCVVTLRQQSTPDAENALHNLIEMGDGAKSELIACYGEETNLSVKALIIHIL